MARFSIRSGFLVTCLLGTLAYLPAWAQAASPAEAAQAAREAERIQREQQERQRQQFLLDQQRKGPATRIEIAPPPSPSGSASSACVKVDQIDINGAPNLPRGDRAKILKAYSQRCLTVADIEKILAEITKSYIDRGYATTRAYIKQQDLSNNRLEILVIEGTLEKIMIDDGDKRSIRAASAFPGVTGKPLNLRDLEQGLDQINRLGSNNATLEIEPGAEPGASVVRIKNTPSSRFHASLTLDNQGSESTGRDQVGVGVTADNLLGLLDYVSFTHRQTLPRDSQRRESVSDNVSYIVPYGYNTYSLGYSRSRYVSTLNTASGVALRSNGDSEISFVRGERVVYRDQNSRAMLAATLTAKQSNNFLAGQLLTVSSRNLTVLDIDATYTTGFLGAIVSLDLGYARGLNWMGALNDPEGLPDTLPRAQFNKFKYGAAISVPFKIGARDAAFSSRLVGQRANDVLYSSEQILIGGIYTVRGFDNTVFTGDDGFYVRNDLSTAIPLQLGTNVMAVVRPYIGLDYGHIHAKAPNTGGASIVGAVVGASISLKAVSLEIFNVRPLSVPNGATRESNATFAQLRITI